MSNELWFVFPINPEPWKVGSAYVFRRGGSMGASIGPNAELQAYQEAVRETLTTDYLNLYDGKPEGPLYPKGTKLKLTCYFWRQRAEYTTHQARTQRKHEIDATNALKAIEDAFQKLLYDNDRDNLEVRSVMVSQDVDIVHPKIIVKLEEYHGFDPQEIPDEIWEEAYRVAGA